MAYVSPSPEVLRALLVNAKTIAVVGASSKPDRPSFGVFRKLQSLGYEVIPVNPWEVEVLGSKAYPTLEAVPHAIDIVDVFRRAEETPAIADSAVKIDAKVLWLQHGIVNEVAAARAMAGGLLVVMDQCIAVTHALLQIPRRRQ